MTMLSEPPRPEPTDDPTSDKYRSPFARKMRGGGLRTGGQTGGEVQDMKAGSADSIFPTLQEQPKSEYRPKLQHRTTESKIPQLPPIDESQKVTKGVFMGLDEPDAQKETAGQAHIRKLQEQAEKGDRGRSLSSGEDSRASRERTRSEGDRDDGVKKSSSLAGGGDDAQLPSVAEDGEHAKYQARKRRFSRPLSSTVFEEATGQVKRYFTSSVFDDESVEFDKFQKRHVEARTRRAKLKKILSETAMFVPDHFKEKKSMRTMSAGGARPRSEAGGSRGQNRPISLADLALPPNLNSVIDRMKDNAEKNPQSHWKRVQRLRLGLLARTNSKIDMSGTKGAVVMAPGGEVVQFGHSMKPDISDVSTWKHLTKEQLIEQLRKHAAEIAARVLRGGGGKDLAADAREAAGRWAKTYPSKAMDALSGAVDSEQSPSEPGPNTAQAALLGQLLANFQNMEDIAAFKDVLLETLGNIVSSLTGQKIVIPPDAEISEELLRALANQEINPEDIEIYVDPITGKTYVRLRKKGGQNTAVERTFGEVVIPAGVDIDDELAAMLAMGQYTADDIEYVFDEKTGRRVARLKQGAVKKPPKIGGIELPEDAIISDDILKALANSGLTADDLEVVWDEKLGRHVVRIKSAAKNKVRQIGNVIIPKDAIIDDALLQALALGEYDADDLEYVYDEKTGKMVVKLKEGAKKKPKKINGVEIPDDAIMDADLLEMLKSGNVAAEDLEFYYDEATGKTIVRLKKKAQERKFGDVVIPADVEIDGELAAMLAMGQYTADDIEYVIDEKTGKRVARLKMGAVKRPPKIGGKELPEDAYIPDDILAALAANNLTADDLEVVWDEKLGRHVVRIKSAARRKVRQIGNVYIPRDAEIDPALAAALAMGEYGADDIEYYYDEKTGKTIVRLKAGAKKKARNIGGVEIPSDAEISAELLAALQSDDITADDIELVWDEATGKMVVRLKSSYRRRKEAEDRLRRGLRPISPPKAKPEFVFGKPKNSNELEELYGPYDKKQVEYGIPELKLKSHRASEPSTEGDLPTVPKVKIEKKVDTQVNEAESTGVKVKEPKVKEPKEPKRPKATAQPKVKEPKMPKRPKEPKQNESEAKPKKRKKKEEEAKPGLKIKPKKLKEEADQKDYDSDEGKRKVKMRTDSGRSYYVDVSDDDDLKTLVREVSRTSVIEVILDAEQPTVVIQEVEIEEVETPRELSPEPSSRELTPESDEALPQDPARLKAEEAQRKDEFAGRARALSKAKAERRRREIEKKRVEREMRIRKEKEDLEQAEKMQQDLEEEMERKMEEARLKREAGEREKIDAIELEEQRELERLAAVERTKRLKEQQRQRMDALRKQQEKEERERRELQRLREEQEQERLQRELSMLAKLSEKERLEFLRKQKEEEEKRQKEEEEEKRREQEEAQRRMEEARRLAEEMMRRQQELEKRLQFNRGLQAESTGLDRAQGISRAFVWSYYELLQWLGLNIPSK